MCPGSMRNLVDPLVIYRCYSTVYILYTSGTFIKGSNYQGLTVYGYIVKVPFKGMIIYIVSLGVSPGIVGLQW